MFLASIAAAPGFSYFVADPSNSETLCAVPENVTTLRLQSIVKCFWCQIAPQMDTPPRQVWAVIPPMWSPIPVVTAHLIAPRSVLTTWKRCPSFLPLVVFLKGFAIVQIYCPHMYTYVTICNIHSTVQLLIMLINQAFSKYTVAHADPKNNIKYR